MINCELCGKKLKNNKCISGHLRFNHQDYTVQKYYDEFLRKDGEGICKLDGCNNKTRFSGIGKGYLDHCCNSHAQKNSIVRNKIENTNERKYGKKNFTNIEKARETKKDRYGDEFYSNRLKSSNTLLNRTDEEKETWRKKVRNKWKNKSLKDKKETSNKRKTTMLEKYGDENYAIKKAQEIIKDKYNVGNISQVPEIREKIRKSWKNKNIDEINNRTIKSRNTMIEKYGIKHIMHNSEIKNKIIRKARDTKIKLGKWLDDDQIPFFKLYYRRVQYFTYRSIKEKFTKEELSKIGKCGIDGALQIDHILSIKEGFLGNILPYIIGHKNNLRLIPWLENDVKKQKSDITIEVLVDSIFEKEIKEE